MSLPENVIELRAVRLDPQQMRTRGLDLVENLATRRSVRMFSPEPVDRELIELAVAAARTAPSGANLQPWHFCIIGDADVKLKLRAAAEVEERAFYEQRASVEWKQALAHLGTDAVKEHLTTAPWVVVMFRERNRPAADGGVARNYYSAESCGIAAGMFITAVHRMGLHTLPHTPSPMTFLAELLGRPANEQAFLVLPVGYAAHGAVVPDISRKPADEVVSWH